MVTVVLAPAFRLPAAAETVSQPEVLTRLQLKGFAPVFLSVYDCEATVYGPPPGPKAVKPSGGVISRLSAGGASRAAIRFAPFGVPRPVQRS